ncbi:hypothetical protein D3C85_837890 [compost metagenome]
MSGVLASGTSLETTGTVPLGVEGSKVFVSNTAPAARSMTANHCTLRLLNRAFISMSFTPPKQASTACICRQPREYFCEVKEKFEIGMERLPPLVLTSDFRYNESKLLFLFYVEWKVP